MAGVATPPDNMGKTGNVPGKSMSTVDLKAKGINNTAPASKIKVHESIQDILHSGTGAYMEYPADKDIEVEKLKLLESARRTARMSTARDKMIKEYEESSDSQDCTTCFTCCSKKRKPCKEICAGENKGKLVRWWTKWLVFIIGVGNFLQAVRDIYNILQFQMKFDYFFAIGIYNCNEWMTIEAYKFLLFVNTVHSTTSCIVLFANSKKTAPFTLYWICSQVLLTSTTILDAFFQLRFSNSDETKSILIWAIVQVIVDIIEITIVLLRFYLLDKPYQARLKKLATSAKLDRTLNGELFIRASVFLRRKSAVREAANFQILAVVKKLREIFTASGMRPTADVVDREVQEALEALKDKSKYPGLRKLQIAEISEADKHSARIPSTEKLRKPPKKTNDKKTIKGIMNPSLNRKHAQPATWGSKSARGGVFN